jgi:TonB family protein
MNVKLHIRFLLLAALLIALQFLATATPPIVKVESPSVVVATSPPYPIIARHAHISGDIAVDVSVNPGGEVVLAKALEGHPLLNITAERAAKQWRFAPAASGSSIRTAVLTFSFRLMPKCAPATDLTPVFYPPYKVEIRGETPPITCDDCSPARQEELRCKNP